MNNSRATWLLIGRWKNSEENKKNLHCFSHRPIRSNYFLHCFSTDQSEANGVICCRFLSVIEIEMHLHGPA
jgi:hypothetical protein